MAFDESLDFVKVCSQANGDQPLREVSEGAEIMKNLASIFLFILVVLGSGIVIGTMTIPGDWYSNLNKPFFNPPAWIFAPVWTLLYLAIAIAGWRVWRRGGETVLWRLWIIQMGLNLLWSPVFFGAQHPGLALVVIITLLSAIISFIAVGWRINRITALLFVPYAVWVGFATALNAAIFYLNPAA